MKTLLSRSAGSWSAVLLPQLPALQEMGSSWMDYTHTRGVWNSIHTHKQTHMCTHSDRHTHLSQSWHCSCSTLSQTDRQTHVHTLTDKQTDRHTHTSHNPGTVAAPHCHRQTDRQTDTRAHTHRQTDRQTHLSQSWHCSCVSVRTCERVTSCMSTRCLSHTWDNPWNTHLQVKNRQRPLVVMVA